MIDATDHTEPTQQPSPGAALTAACAATADLDSARARRAPVWAIRALQEIEQDPLAEADRHSVRHRV